MEDADGAAWQRAAQLIPARSLRRASEFVHSTEFTARTLGDEARRALSLGDISGVLGRFQGAISDSLSRFSARCWQCLWHGGRGLGAHVRSRYRWMVE